VTIKLTKSAAPVKLAPPKPSLPLKLSAKDINSQVVKPAKLTGRSHTAMDRNVDMEKISPGAFLGDTEKPGAHEVRIIEHTTSGRRELDRVCQEKGLVWGILNTSVTYNAGQPGKMKAFVLIGHQYEFEVDETGGYPQAVDAALHGLAGELESEG